MPSTNAEKQFETYSKYAPAIVSITILLLLIIYFSNFHNGFGDQATFGAFGDFVGGILNPILSFITILLLIYSLRFQLQELGYTRDEIKKTNQIHTSNVQQQKRLFEATNYLEELKLFQSKLDELVVKKVMHVRISKGFPWAGLNAQEGVNYVVHQYSISDLFAYGNRYADFKRHAELDYLEQTLEEINILFGTYTSLISSLKKSECDESLYRVKDNIIRHTYHNIDLFIDDTNLNDLVEFKTSVTV
ncbi:hypothetical protein ACKJ8N_003564 [Vibrio cholerae]